MCFRQECKQCGKYTWAGCGDHLNNLYASIEKGKHCMCRPWPGVVIPPDATTTAASSAAARPSKSSTTTGKMKA